MVLSSKGSQAIIFSFVLLFFFGSLFNIVTQITLKRISYFNDLRQIIAASSPDQKTFFKQIGNILQTVLKIFIQPFLRATPNDL